MTEKIFSSLGFKRKEIKVAMALLNGKGFVASELAVEVGMPRQTVLSILKRLVRIGLVTRSSKNGVGYFILGYQELNKYIEDERDRMSKLKHLLDGKKEALVRLGTRSIIPGVEYYDGELGLRKLFESILAIYKKKKSKRFRGYGINFFSNAPGLEEYLEYFIKKRSEYGVKTNLFLAEGPDGFNVKGDTDTLNRKVKKLSMEPQNAAVYIVADRVYLFSYKDNAGIMIQNPAIVELLKSTFDDHWDKTA